MAGNAPSSNPSAGDPDIAAELLGIAKAPRGVPRDGTIREATRRFQTAKIGVESQFVNHILARAQQIKAAHPDMASEIELNEWKIRERLENLRSAIDQLPEIDRELVTVIVINSIHELCDDVLVADHVKRESEEEAHERPPESGASAI